jgi:hypothetical protein
MPRKSRTLACAEAPFHSRIQREARRDPLTDAGVQVFSVCALDSFLIFLASASSETARVHSTTLSEANAIVAVLFGE